jgi:hypothetical protein
MTQTITEGTLKVSYIPQIPGNPYEVIIQRLPGLSDEDYLKQAAQVLDAVVGLSIFEFDNRIKPDYSDLPSISRWENDGEGFDWFDVDESDYETWDWDN